MKVTSVELRRIGISGAFGSTPLVLSFRDPSRTSKFNVKNITGIDADAIVAKFYGVSVPGTGDIPFYNLSMEKREVVIQIQLNPQVNLGESYSSLRDELYRIISATRVGKVRIDFVDSADPSGKKALSGTITKLETVQFDREQEVQLSIKADSPFIEKLGATQVPPSGLITDLSTLTINDVESTAPHGFILYVNFSVAAPTFKIEDTDNAWKFEVAPLGGFLNNDVLIMWSIPNNKKLELARPASPVIYLADKIQPGSVWPVLFPGTNVLHFTPSPGTYLAGGGLAYWATFWGV